MAFACKHWHYSGSFPASRRASIGVWEDGEFIGVVVFAKGLLHLADPYGLGEHEVCELSRVALKEHRTPVTRIISVALRMLRKHSPGIRLVVSFADPLEGHLGKIYQAGNWIYTGMSATTTVYVVGGRRLHRRAFVNKNFGTKAMEIPKDAVKMKATGKHRYVMPLDEEIRPVVESMRQPFPQEQPCAGSIDSDAPGPPARRGRCDSDLGAPKPLT